MGQLYSMPDFGQKLGDCLPLDQREVLERAVAKLVVIGQRVGVSASDMIELLESGLTVRELLEYLALQDDAV